MVSTQKISSYLRKPYDLDAEAEQDLREVVKKYPYFNNAWLLLARALQNQNSPFFDDSLKQAAMYAGDRALLYKLVNIDVPVTDEPVIDTQAPQEIAPTTQVPYEPTIPTLAADEPVVQETAAHLAETNTVQEQETPAVTTATDTNTTEEAKVVSAYNEIFGAAPDTEVSVSEEFEQFDINEPFYTQPSLADSEEEEFKLQVDEPHHVESVAENEIQYTIETPAKSGEEELELNVGELLDADHDGLIPPAPLPQNSEEELELEIADSLTSAQEPMAEEEFELQLGEQLDADHDGIIPPAPLLTNSEEELELAIADILQEKQQPESQQPVYEETMPAEEERHEIEIPIAFKLDKKTTAPQVEPANEQPTQENVLVSPGDFYDWLAHLKNPTSGTEKKNDVAVVAPEVQKTDAPPAPKKTSVDEIIERFIAIQPRISRPKAEFYNPTQKAKESDTEADDLATETLARIYRSQKLYDKAIEVYHKLIHIYPNNEAAFRAKISEIEQEKG